MVKLAHIAVATPHRCGLYETTRELVAALRTLGVDSRICDPTREKNTLHPKEAEDRGALFADMDWAAEADLLINHSGLGERLEATDTPVIHMLHGRPRSSFLIEMKGSTPIFSYHYHKSRDKRFRACVTFWPEHVPFHQVMWPETPIHAIQPPVDLERWTPKGPAGYSWHNHGADINVVSTDAWRDDIDPFNTVHAFALFARTQPSIKLHIFGNSKNLKAWAPLLKRIQDERHLGEVCGWVLGLENVYRAADLMLTAHTINTRAVREAMACGCPVQRINCDLRTARIVIPHRSQRASVRAEAERLFDPAVTARQFMEICDGCHY